MKEIKLGNKIKDKITGVVGIADAKIMYLNGCVQYSIRQQVKKDGTLPKDIWVDEQQVQIIGRGVAPNIIIKVVPNAEESSPKVGGGIRSHAKIGMHE